MLTFDKLILCVQKDGYDKKDFEDAFSAPYEEGPGGHIRVAIADGATESSFSKEWANLLVNEYRYNSQFSLENDTLLEDLMNRWERKVGGFNLPWFASEKRNIGAFAAFLGVDIDPVTGHWVATAIGDSCLFVVRNNQLLTSFPFSKQDEFNNSPHLISSKEKNNRNLKDWTRIASGNLMSGDLLIMATDAISDWFLKEVTAQGQPWLFPEQLMDTDRKDREKKKLLDIWLSVKNDWMEANKIKKDEDTDYFTNLVFTNNGSSSDVERWMFTNWIFRRWLTGWRDSGHIKNDDTTLFLIKVK